LVRITGLELGYLKVNPANACKLPRIEKPEIKPLDEQQIAAFLKEIDGHQFETLYILTLFSGMRQGEILGLSWQNVDFKAGTITIDRQLQLIRGVYKHLSVKNDRVRKITPAPAIMQLLKAHKSQQAAAQLKAGAMWENPFNLVFTNELGINLKRYTVYKYYKQIVKRIGIEESRFHDLRHSYAVAALQSGDDVKTVQANLGHHSAAFTLDQYGHVTEKMRQDSANRMDQFYRAVRSL
jgi:integrase